MFDEFFMRLANRIDYLRLSLEGQGNVHSCAHQISALQRDADSNNLDKRHYTFDFLPQSEFTDFVLAKISSALEKSKKATAITLFHGDVTDAGMNRFLKALQKTSAPIKSLNFEDLPYVTNESMEKLPEIIKEKGIRSCNISLLSLSPELQKQISNACNENVAFLSKGLRKER